MSFATTSHQNPAALNDVNRPEPTTSNRRPGRTQAVLRSALTAVLLIGALVVFPLAGAPAASAACNPAQDARNLESFWFDSAGGVRAKVELRYSPQCDLGWARVADGAGCNYFHCELGVLEVSGRQSDEFPTGHGQYWSRFESFRRYMRACVRIGDGANPSQQYLCTAWR